MALCKYADQRLSYRLDLRPEGAASGWRFNSTVPEHKQPPALFQYFNTTGSNLQHAELEAAVELLISTHREIYGQRLKELVPVIKIKEKFAFLGGTASRAIPLMDDQFKQDIAEGLAANKPKLEHMLAEDPYAVPIFSGTWGGAGAVTQFATEMYFLHRAFPELVGPEQTLHAIDYVLGRHPVSNVSYVSGVGAQSRLIAYGK